MPTRPITLGKDKVSGSRQSTNRGQRSGGEALFWKRCTAVGRLHSFAVTSKGRWRKAWEIQNGFTWDA